MTGCGTGLQRPDPHALARDALAGLDAARGALTKLATALEGVFNACLLYTSAAADGRSSVDLGGRRIIKKKEKKNTKKKSKKNTK